VAQAQSALEEEQIAFVPVAALCPGLASLLAVRNRLGVRNSAHVVAKLLDPFNGDGVLLASASTQMYLDKLAAFFLRDGGTRFALGEYGRRTIRQPAPPATHRVTLRMESAPSCSKRRLARSSQSPACPEASMHTLPPIGFVRALAGEAPIPHPLVNQLACCLFVSGYTEDMNQAKAIAAVEAGSLGTVGRRRTGPGRIARVAPR
jgi:anthranilate phosphoribosyltransferase